LPLKGPGISASFTGALVVPIIQLVIGEREFSSYNTAQ
jgi:hypothetical protein